MPLTFPNQVRSVDPYSDNRFSSVINRLSRLVTGGNDCILFGQQSFSLTRLDWQTVRIGPGICIKNDVLIHIIQNFDVDFDDNDFYVDETGAMDNEGYYYILLQYFYSRSLPTPQAALRIVRDVATLYTPYSNRYIFLGTANIIYNIGETRYELEVDPDCISHNDPSNPSVMRPMPESSWLYVDGGLIT